MKKRTLAMFLALLIAMLSACGSADTVNETTGTPHDTTETTPAETEPDYDPKLPAIDGGGADFGILARKVDGSNYCQQTDDVTAEEQTGEALNDAMYTRNAAVMDKYNISFAIQSDGNAQAVVKKNVQAGDAASSLVFLGLQDGIALSAEKMLFELESVPHLDYTKPYWGTQVMDDTSIYNEHYVGIGDVTTQAYFSSGIVYYNKNLATQYQMENPYDLVVEGKWTLDKLKELCRNVSSDLNGNGEYDENDQYGITFNNFAWQILFYGGGMTFITKDDTGSLVFDASNENLISSLQTMMPISQDAEVCLYSENYKHLGGNYRIDVCQNAFNEGRALFWLEAMYGVPDLREMENDFGILPVPKFSETQEGYSSFIHPGHASCVVVPVTAADLELTGSVLEDMAWYSSTTVRDAFVETTLKGKYARDNDSAESIDVIMNSIRMDYGLLLVGYGLTIDSGMRGLMDKGSTDITSFFAANAEKYTAVLDKYCASFTD